MCPCPQLNSLTPHPLIPLTNTTIRRRMEVTTAPPSPPYQVFERRKSDRSDPAVRVPLEIFSNILVELSLSFWDEEGPKTWKYHPVPWLAVTHVCQRWRQIAVHHPHLSCHIKAFLVDNHAYAKNFVDQEYKTWLITVVLGRSKELPLTIEVHGQPAARSILSERDVLKPILENIHRVKTLTFPYSHAFYALYLDFFQSHFSGLEHLAIGFVTPIKHDIQPVFASSQLPNLRSFDVRGLPLTSLSGLFRPSLRHVDLIHFQFTNDPTLFSTLGNYLENTPSLESLNLNMTNFDPPPPGTQSVAVTTRVELPNLQCLWFSCNVPNTLEFFDHVAIPTQTQLDLRLLPVPPLEFEIQTAKTFVTPILQTSVRHFKHPLTTIELYLTLYPMQNDGADAVVLESNTGFRVDIAVSDASNFQLTEILCVALPLSGLRHLRLGDLELTSVIDIIRLFGPFKEVEELKVDGSQVPLVVQALAESCSSEDSVLFPKLRHLELWDDYEFSVLGRDELNAIRCWLGRRLEAGYKILALTFVNSTTLTEQDVEALESVVDEVIAR